MDETATWGKVCSRSQAITAFFPYAVWQERNGQHEILNAFFHAVRALGEPWFMWYHIEPLVTMLLNKESPVSVRQATILVSPHLPWWNFHDEHLAHLWAAAASAVPYTDEIGQIAVDTLFHIASNHILQPHIPVGMWLWLNKCPSLPPVCVGRAGGSTPYVIRQVHDLGDTKTIKSYLLLIWSEWDCLYLRWGKSHSLLLDYVYLVPEGDRFYKRGPPEMCTLIKKNFGGVEMGDHRQDLLQRLNHILGQLNPV